MKDHGSNSNLTRALALSQEMFAAAESADLASLERLDAERLELLKSFRIGTQNVNAADGALLRQISQLNDRTIGLLEHQRRSKGRDMDPPMELSWRTRRETRLTRTFGLPTTFNAWFTYSEFIRSGCAPVELHFEHGHIGCFYLFVYFDSPST